MIVFRLTEETWRLGVLTLETGDVKWLSVTPESTGLGRTVAWRSETEIVAIARPADDLPLVLRLGWQAQARKTALGRQFEAGHVPSAVYIPSGAQRDSRDQASPARLVRIDVGSGQETVLATGEMFDFELSPDGRWVAAILNADDLQPGANELVRIGTPTRLRRLVMVDVERGQATQPLPGQDMLSHLLTWSPDSRAVLAFGRSDGDTWDQGHYWRISGRVPTQPVALHGGTPWVNAAADGIPQARAGWSRNKAVVQVRAADGSRRWLREGDGRSESVREPMERLVFRAGTSWIERADGLHPFDPGRGLTVVPGRLWDRERAADGGGRTQINPSSIDRHDDVILEPDGCLRPAIPSDASTCLPALEGEETVVAVSSDARFMVTQQRSGSGSIRLAERSASGVRTIVSLNPALDDVAWGEIQAVTHPGPEGQSLKSWLLLPSDTDADRPPPLAVIVYPGDTYQKPPGWLLPGSERRHINPAVLAANGFAVLVPSLPRPAGDGTGLDDIGARIGAIVDAAALQARIDGSRVALIGHSYGGHGVLRAATQTDRFQAIVSSLGITDLSRAYAIPPHYAMNPSDGVPVNVRAGWTETGQGSIGSSLIIRPEDYVRNSPLYLAERIRTPTLLIEGDQDPEGADIMFSALYRQGREAALLTYVGEGHVFVSPANLRDLHIRILEWLNRYLRPSNVSDPGLPPARPDLQDRADQQPVVVGTGDQARLR